MTQTSQNRIRSGWRAEETELLFAAVEQAERDGRPLRDAFGDVGQQLGRKPNSIRNYYYARVREEPERHGRKPPFRVFTGEELHQLLRDVLTARARGESVRACVTRLAEGDRSRMLRYQNKYRSTLKAHPELIRAVADELRTEGIEVPPVTVPSSGSREERGAGLYRRAVELSLRTGDRSLSLWLEGYVALAQRLLDAEERAAQGGTAPQAADEGLRRSESPEPCDMANQPDAADEVRLAVDDSVPAVFPDAEAFHRKWLEARREADRLKVQVDLLKMRVEDLETE